MKSKNKMEEILKFVIEELEDEEISHKEEQERRGRVKHQGRKLYAKYT